MKLTPAARRLLTVLKAGAYSMDELAAIAGISRSTVKRAIKELETFWQYTLPADILIAGLQNW